MNDLGTSTAWALQHAELTGCSRVVVLRVWPALTTPQVESHGQGCPPRRLCKGRAAESVGKAERRSQPLGSKARVAHHGAGLCKGTYELQLGINRKDGTTSEPGVPSSGSPGRSQVGLRYTQHFPSLLPQLTAVAGPPPRQRKHPLTALFGPRQRKPPLTALCSALRVNGNTR